MVVRRRKKTRKKRGSKTYGWGEEGHRKSGYRGGKGKAGGHKHHWTKTIVEDPEYFGRGRRGINRPKKIVYTPTFINIGEISERIDKLLEKGVAVREEGMIKVDVKKMGFDKVLGAGRIEAKLHVLAPKFTKKAAEKIEKAGGKVTVIEVQRGE